MVEFINDNTIYSMVLLSIIGSLYGFIIGLIPVAGATTGLLTMFGLVGLFDANPYNFVIFATSFTIASAFGDSFTSITMNIPGSNGSSASMIDGFPLTKQGRSAYALSAAITSSAVNGIIYGILLFIIVDWYSVIVMHIGVPELLLLTVLSLMVVSMIGGGFISGIAGLTIGCALGLVGTNPVTGAERYTMGFDYLGMGINDILILTGFLAMPEIYEMFKSKQSKMNLTNGNSLSQIKDGILVTFKNLGVSIKGGVIGFIVGVLPGLNATVADWTAYGVTTKNKKGDVQYGKGNIVGVIGAEGANNAHKAGAFLPTILFGIAGAPFAAVLMSLYLYIGLEMGSTNALTDTDFTWSIQYGYLSGIVFGVLLAFATIPVINKILNVNFKILMIPILLFVIWASVFKNNMFGDYALLFIFSLAGVFFKKLGINRIALVLGFILIDRIELLLVQFNSMYVYTDLYHRPISLILVSLLFILLSNVILKGFRKCIASHH